MEDTKYHLFARRYEYYGPFRQPTSVNIVRYNQYGVQQEQLPVCARKVKESINSDTVNWIRVTGLENAGFISELMLSLGFYSVDIKAILTPCRATKFNRKTGRVLIVMRSCSFDNEDEVVTGHLALVAKENFVITFRELPEPSDSPVVKAINENVLDVRRRNPLYLIALLLNSVFAQSLETALRIEDMLETLDDMLLDATHNRLNVARKIERCRHANLILQKNTVMLYDEFKEFIERNMGGIDNEEALISDELVDQLQYIVMTTINCKELLSSMRDLYTANNELKTNAVMKRLTIVSTFFIPITFLVGLWGMNFKYMPEFGLKYGYPLAIIVISLTAFLTWRYMKKHGWF